MEAKSTEQDKIVTLQGLRTYITKLVEGYHAQLVVIPKEGLERLQGATILAMDILGKIDQIQKI